MSDPKNPDPDKTPTDPKSTPPPDPKELAAAAGSGPQNPDAGGNKKT